MKSLPGIIAAIVMSIFMWACRSTPPDVLEPDEMVSLMVDIHRGEALADMDYTRYGRDSMKALLRKSVYNRHGITQEQFDTTMAWYGHHIDKFNEIYDRVIEKLEVQLEEAGSAANGATSISGDSVNTWGESPYYVITRRTPADFLSFNLDRDDNWKNGDSYTWQFKVFNRGSEMEMAMCVDYDDGTTDTKITRIGDDGWTRMTMVLDSVRQPNSVYGYINFNARPAEEIYIDSMSLVRKRFDSRTYSRRYDQHRFKYGKQS